MLAAPVHRMEEVESRIARPDNGASPSKNPEPSVYRGPAAGLS
jgi:hypothetical protein